METLFHKLQSVPLISLDYKISPFPTFSFFNVSFPIKKKKRISCNKANKLRMDSSQGISAPTQQKIVIPNSNNEKLVGLLHETGSTEIVVLCHGFRSTKTSSTFFVLTHMELDNGIYYAGFRVTEESLMERLNTDIHEACLKIDKECRVLTVHGSADEVIPLGDAKEFAKIIPNHKLEIVEGADHCYTKHQSQLVTTVMEFIKTVIVKNN
ncbi:unnamed protein product [Arabidopsis halleri]